MNLTLLNPLPINNGFLNATLAAHFSVQINGNNINLLTPALFYRRQGVAAYLKKPLNCVGSGTYNCSVMVNLDADVGALEGDTIEFFFNATDTFNNTGELGNASAPLTAVIDLTPPAVFPLGPSGILSSSDVLLEASVLETLAGTGVVNADGSECALVNNSGVWGCSLLLADGKHQARFFVSDVAGNWNNSETTSFSVDTTAPRVMVLTPNFTISSNSTVLFTASVLEEHPGTGTVDVDGSFCTLTNASGVWSCTIGGLTDGSHTALFTLIDSVGNVRFTNSSPFIIDTIVPAFQNPLPANGSLFSPLLPLRLSVTLTEEHPNRSTVFYKRHGAQTLHQAALNCTGGPVYDCWNVFDVSGFMGNGDTLDFWFNATDQAGNNGTSGSDTSPYQLVSDNILPSMSATMNASYVKNSTVFSIAANVSDVHLNRSSVAVTGDGITFIALEDRGGNAFGVDLSAGQLTCGSVCILAVSAKDTAGNINTVSLLLSVDNDPPLISSFTVNNSVSRRNGTLLFSANVVDRNISRVFIANATAQDMENKTGSWQLLTSTPAALGCPSSGECTIHLTATDRAGNSNTSVLVITLDDIPPVITVVSPRNISYSNTTILLSIDFVDDHPLEALALVDANTSRTLAQVDNSSRWTFADSSLGQGAHNVTFSARDRADNVVSSSLLVFTVDREPPEFTIDSPLPVTYTTTASIDFNITADEALSFAVAATNASSFSMRNDSAIHFFNLSSTRALLTDGNYTLTFTAQDRVSNERMHTVNFSVAVPPSVAVPDVFIPEDTGMHDNILFLPNFAHDNGLAPNKLSYTLVNLTPQTGASCTIDTTKHLDCITIQQNYFGIVSYQILVSDGHYVGSDTFLLNVTAVNDAPVLDKVPDVSFDEDTSGNDLVDLAAYASDVDSSSLGFSIILQSNTSAANCAIDGTFLDCTAAPDVSGSSYIIVQVSDGQLTDDDVLIVTVNPVNDRPRILSIPTAIATRGELYTYVVQAADIDGDNLQFSLRQNPDGMNITSLNATAALVTWLPDGSLFPGSASSPSQPRNNKSVFENVTVVITVTDQKLKVNQGYSIRVLPPVEGSKCSSVLYDGFDSTQIDTTKWNETTNNGAFTDEHLVNTSERTYHLAQNNAKDSVTFLYMLRPMNPNESLEFDINYRDGIGNRIAYIGFNDYHLQDILGVSNGGAIGFWNTNGTAGNDFGLYHFSIHYFSHGANITIDRPDGTIWNVDLSNSPHGAFNPPYYMKFVAGTGNNGLMHFDYDTFSTNSC